MLLFMLGVEGANGVDQLALLVKPVFPFPSLGAADLHVDVLHLKTEAVENGAQIENKQ